MPTMLIGLATASSAAAFRVNMKTCRSKYGIDDRICSFGVPLGMVMSKPTSVYVGCAVVAAISDPKIIDGKTAILCPQ